MSLRDSFREKRKSLGNRLSITLSQVFTNGDEDGSPTTTLVDQDSTNGGSRQTSDTSFGCPDGLNPLRFPDAQHSASSQAENRPSVDDNNRPHLEELGRWPDDQLLNKLRRYRYLNAYAEVTALETRHDQLGATESTLFYDGRYFKDQNRQHEHPIQYPAVTLPSSTRSEGDKKKKQVVPGKHQPRHFFLRVKGRRQHNDKGAELEAAKGWLSDTTNSPRQPLDRPEISMLQSSNLAEHGPRLRAYAQDRFEDFRRYTAIWHRHDGAFQVGLLNALQAAQIPRADVQEDSGSSILTLGLPARRPTLSYLGELIKLLLRLERRLNREIPSANDLKSAMIAVDEGQEPSTSPPRDSVRMKNRVRPGYSKYTNWCKGTAREQIQTFNDYFCWLLIAPWPHEVLDPAIDAGDLRDGDRFVWRFTARCFPHHNLVEEWLNFRRKKARQWLTRIQCTVEVLMHVYQGATMEPGDDHPSRDFFYCLSRRDTRGLHPWVADMEWKGILEDWLLLAMYDIMQIFESVRRPDVPDPDAQGPGALDNDAPQEDENGCVIS